MAETRSVVVTGAYGGMGRAASLLLTSRGFRVYALDLSVLPPEKNIVPLQCDVTDGDAVARCFEAISRETDSLFALIHFAGIYMLDSLAEMETGDFRRIFEINVTGAHTVNRVFMPLLKKGSRIIMTTSELAPLSPLPFTGIYAVTKSALDKYAFSLRMELQLLDIRVSVIRAGAVSTGMLGVSTAALDRFCRETRLYACNAVRFKKIVDSVEARSVPPEKIGEKALKILGKKNPKFAYRLNRNPLLLLLNALPPALQFWVIKQVLKP